VSASSRTGEARETPGGRFVSRSALDNAGRSDTTQMCLCPRRPLCPPSPHVHLATVAQVKVH